MDWKFRVIILLFGFLIRGSSASFTKGTLLSIKPVPCKAVENNRTLEGTCMFVWDCMKRNGRHLSTCRYNFLFGSCCLFSDSENAISQDHDDQKKFGKVTTTKSPPVNSFPSTPISKSTVKPFPSTEVSLQLHVSNQNQLNEINKQAPSSSAVVPQNSVTLSVSNSVPQNNYFNFNNRVPTLPPRQTTTAPTVKTTTTVEKTSVPSTTVTFFTPQHQYTFKTPYKERTTVLPYFEKKATTTKSPNTYKPVIFFNENKSTTTTSSTTTTTTTTTIPIPKTTTFTENPHPDIKWDYYEGCGIPPLFKNGRPGHTRIVGGKNTAFGQYPWQVSVRRTSFFGFSSTHRCGGALIDAQWVATAGHCVDDLMKSQIRVRIGEYDFARSTEAFQHEELGIITKIVHPKYNFFTYENDLALIKLEKKLDLRPNVWPICLPPDEHNLIGLEATVTGWGRLKDGGILPSILQEVQVPILSNEKCKNMFLKRNKHEYIPDIFVCAGYDQGGRDSCQGDSGGPLQIKRHGRWFLAGIVSWGIGCAEPNLPGVSTRISKFKSWILTQLRNNQ